MAVARVEARRKFPDRTALVVMLAFLVLLILLRGLARAARATSSVSPSTARLLAGFRRVVGQIAEGRSPAGTLGP